MMIFEDEHIRAVYPPKDLISPGGNLPDILWKAMNVDMSETGISLNANFEFENPVSIPLNCEAKIVFLTKRNQ